MAARGRMLVVGRTVLVVVSVEKARAEDAAAASRKSPLAIILEAFILVEFEVRVADDDSLDAKESSK